MTIVLRRLQGLRFAEFGELFDPSRGVAVADGEIYVTDTGNERVQVFASDGTFLRAFGGFGGKSLSVGLFLLNTESRLRNDSRIGRRPLSFFSPNGLLRTLEPRPFDGGKP